MNPYADALNSYLAGNPVKAGCANITELLDILYCCYCQRKAVDPQSISDCFAELDHILSGLSIKDNSRVVALTCNLCTQHAREAFRNGVAGGFHLFKELHG